MKISLLTKVNRARKKPGKCVRKVKEYIVKDGDVLNFCLTFKRNSHWQLGLFQIYILDANTPAIVQLFVDFLASIADAEGVVHPR